MSQDTSKKQLIINVLSEAQYRSIPSPSETELYLVNDESEVRRNIGELIYSVIPLTDAGLHLADGSLINGTGIYTDFYNYMLELYGDGTNIPNYFTDENTYQTSITNYGVCGKFVINTTNQTIRLPKITGIVEGTVDVAALGNLVEAGLPNITGQWASNAPGNYQNGVGGAISNSTASISNVPTNSGSSSYGFSFNASLSNSIYGNSNTVQPQTIKGFYYIVIASSVKTEIEVNIDRVTTDLNGKVNKTDLVASNVVIESYVNGTSWYRVWSDGWIEQGGRLSLNPDGNATVTLLKSFSNTNYTITTTTYHTGTTVSGYNNAGGNWVQNITTSSFKMYEDEKTVTVLWYACGK